MIPLFVFIIATLGIFLAEKTVGRKKAHLAITFSEKGVYINIYI